MLQGYTMAIVPCGNPTPKKLPTGDGEWPTFRTARAQRTVRPPVLAIMVSKRRGNCNSYTGKLNTTSQRVDGTSKQAQPYNASPLW